MPPIERDRTSKCRGCGQEIRFIKTVKGKTMPVNPEKVWVRLANGEKPYLKRDGTFVTGEIVGDAYDMNDPDSELIEAYESHFATCPEAGRFRGRRK